MGKNQVIKEMIGQEYLFGGGFVNETSTHVQAAFQEINKVNRELFEFIPYKVVFTSDDVYASAKEMRERVQKEGVIYIYNGWSGHPLLTMEDNLIGRAVHDCLAHLVCGCSFSFEGELSAYNTQKLYYPEWTWDVLFAEIVGQTSAYYANGKSHDFDQRAIAAPKRWMELAEIVELPDFSANSILKPLFV